MGRYIVYHDNCYDGFAAAWAAHCALRNEPDVMYLPASYGKEFPSIEDGSTVTILDFCPPTDAILDMLIRGCRVHIEDHHKTAFDIVGVTMDKWQANCMVNYETDVVLNANVNRYSWNLHMDHSGAYLAWKYFFPHTEVPKLILYVEDRDLWKFELTNSREISAWIGSHAFDFDDWDIIADWLEDSGSRCSDEGIAILRYKEQNVKAMAMQHEMMTISGYVVPVANASVSFSEVGEYLCNIHPEAKFAAYYYVRGDRKIQWGLRSQGTFDVSEIAKQFGGGGHRNAAGFTTDIENDYGSSYIRMSLDAQARRIEYRKLAN